MTFGHKSHRRSLRLQFALYADTERGRYPVWQGLDIEGFFPGSGVVFATVTVIHAPHNPAPLGLNSGIRVIIQNGSNRYPTHR